MQHLGIVSGGTFIGVVADEGEFVRRRNPLLVTIRRCNLLLVTNTRHNPLLVTTRRRNLLLVTSIIAD